jgi:hypothetical protein
MSIKGPIMIPPGANVTITVVNYWLSFWLGFASGSFLALTLALIF